MEIDVTHVNYNGDKSRLVQVDHLTGESSVTYTDPDDGEQTVLRPAGGGDCFIKRSPETICLPFAVLVRMVDEAKELEEFTLKGDK